MGDAGEITELLNARDSGTPDTDPALYRGVYDELRKIARSHRRRWRGDETLNTTALISEAYLKLAGRSGSSWNNRGHFYATAAMAMRQILVSYAQAQRAAKRGGDAVSVRLRDEDWVDEQTADQVLAVHTALKALESEHPRECKVVECRVFGGYSVEETAEALQISKATVKRDWASASVRLSDAFGGVGPS